MLKSAQRAFTKIIRVRQHWPTTRLMGNRWSNLLLLRRHSLPKIVIIDRHAWRSKKKKKRFPKSCAVCWVDGKRLGDFKEKENGFEE